MASEVRACYRTSLNMARKQGKGLRLRLRIDPTFRNLWAWLGGGRDGAKPRVRRPKIELA